MIVANFIRRFCIPGDGSIRKQAHFCRSRTGHPHADRKQHCKHQGACNLQCGSPTKPADQKIRCQGRDNPAEAKTKVGISHGLAAPYAKPLRDQDLVGNGASQRVSDDLCNTEQFILPEVRHSAHQDKRQANQSDPRKNDAASTDPIDQRAGKKTERQSDNQSAEQKSLRHLRPRKSQRRDKRRIENRKAVVNDAGGKKKIEERGGDNPPAIEKSGRRADETDWCGLNHEECKDRGG